MRFFIDTANLKDIQEAYDMGILDGVTTNPSLMAKEGISGDENVLNHYLEILLGWKSLGIYIVIIKYILLKTF